MKNNLLFIDFNVNVTITISIAFGVLVGGTSVALYFIKNPDKLEKLIALFYKTIKWVYKAGEYQYIKYDIQSKVNGYTAELVKKVPNITPVKVKLDWVKVDQKPEQYAKNGELILRMHKSNNQNQNVVNATFAFVSYSLLRKAKSHIAKYQKDSIDLFVAFKILEKEKIEILDSFVQDYLKDSLENEKIEEFYSKFFDIDRAGIFFPVFISEMTFLGEKVFGKKRDNERIFKEVRMLVIFLYGYANRKINEEGIRDFVGEYCKFAIRIIGKSIKIHREGEKVYINNLKKISKKVETVYLIGDKANKDFMKNKVLACQNEIDYSIFSEMTYPAKIFNVNGKIIEVSNYLLVLRSNKIQVYHNQ